MKQSTALLRELLEIERDRLQVARRIEQERRIVFPETTVIIRDILRISAELDRREGANTPTEQMQTDLSMPEIEL